MEYKQFGILDAARKAWLFMTAEHNYLLRIALMPLALNMATAFFMQYERPEAGILEAFLWSLPSNIVLAWFLFAQTRLLILGERIDALSSDTARLLERRVAMNLSVLMLLLFDACVTAATAWMDWSVKSKSFGANMPVTVSIFALIGVLFWGLRFSVVYILAAVGYPVRAFLRRVRGMEFPLRLVALGFLCAAPVYFFMGVSLEAAAPLMSKGEADDVAIATAILISAPFSMLATALMSAGAAFALKDMLGREQAR